MSDLIDAVRAGADPERLRECAVPDTYRAAYLSREDEQMFEGETDKDVRRSLHVGDVPMPELAPDEVLVAVMAAGINYNTVWSAIFEPVSSFRFLERTAAKGGPYARHNQPFHVLGSDAAGIIVGAGSLVRRWSIGDSCVICPSYCDEQEPGSYRDAVTAADPLAWGFETNFGALAHLTVVKASQLMPKPKHLSWEESACNTLCAMTAYRMLVSDHGARVKQGEIVLVWGASGGLGAYAIQMIRNAGARAVGVVSSDQKAEAVEALGCDLVLRRDELGLDDLKPIAMGKVVGKAIRSHFGEDAHTVFEHVGRATFGASVYLVRRGGIVITCGSSSGYRHEYDNRHLWMGVKRIIGSHGANWYEACETNRLIALGQIVPPLTNVFSLEEVGEAARLVQTNGHIGKVGVLCLAEQEGLGIEDPQLRAKFGEERITQFRKFARGGVGAAAQA